jgi:hypothetical protein
MASIEDASRHQVILEVISHEGHWNPEQSRHCVTGFERQPPAYQNYETMEADFSLGCKRLRATLETVFID